MDDILHNPLLGVFALFIVMAIDLFIRCAGGSSTPKDKKKK